MRANGTVAVSPVIVAMQAQAHAQLIDPNKPRAFSLLVRLYRERQGVARGTLARTAGIDPSYLTRLENADRTPARLSIVDSLARALHLGPVERDRLLVAAGYTPEVVNNLGFWDESLELVASVLTNPHYTAEERTQFRTLIRLIAQRW